MSKRPELKKGISKKLLIIISIVIAVVIGVTVVVTYGLQPSTVIADGVYVNSLSVGGMTPEEATEKISQKYNEEYFNKTVPISYNGKTYELNLKDAVSVNAEETAKLAFEKSGNVFSEFFNKGNVVVPFVLETNSDAVKGKISKFFMESEEISDAFVFNDDYTSVEIDATKFEKAIDVDGTLELVYENAKNNKFDQVEAKVLEKGDSLFAETIYQNLVREPVNATVGVNEDKSTYIVPEIIGIEADKAEFLKLYKEKKGKFTMTVKPIYPEITTDDLNIEFYQDVLGSYTSSYNAGLVNRTKNVTLAAKFVNGTVIMPGETFSYNKVVGPRTYARGFADATVYTAEGTEEGVGGGICQVSSTLYCAQLRANLKTISRTNHSYTVVYVPLGQDATVSYGSIDYIFKNDTNFPIKIQAYASGGKLTVKILGTKQDKSLTYDVVSVRNSTTPRGEKRVDDPTLPAGTTKVKQNGQDGAVYSAYKIHYKNGVEIKREFISKDVYRPMNRIVLVGTMPVEPSTDTLPEDGEADADVPENTENSDTNIEGGESITPPPVPETNTDETVENTENSVPVTPTEGDNSEVLPVVPEDDGSNSVEEKLPELSDTGL